MGRTRKKAPDPSTAEPDRQIDPSFDVATLERQQTAAEVVGQVADHYAMPPDTSHADRVTRREPVVQSGLTFARADVLAGVRQGEGFRLVGNYKVREVVMAFDEKPSGAVITAMHEAGFVYKPADKIWTMTIGHQAAAQDRLHGERTFETVAGMIRQERNIEHGVGVN